MIIQLPQYCEEAAWHTQVMDYGWRILDFQLLGFQDSWKLKKFLHNVWWDDLKEEDTDEGVISSKMNSNPKWTSYAPKRILRM